MADSNAIAPSENLIRLQSLCRRLSGEVPDTKRQLSGRANGVGHSDQLLNVVADILTELTKADGVTDSELVKSGVVGCLLDYFSVGHLSVEDASNTANLERIREQATKRLNAFLELSLPSNYDGNEAPLAKLCLRLQGALNAVERFSLRRIPSRLYDPRPRFPAVSTTLSLAPPFQLRFSRGEGETDALRDYSSLILYIDPLDQLTSVEAHLWPRVFKGDHHKRSQMQSCSASTSKRPVQPNADDDSDDEVEEEPVIKVYDIYSERIGESSSSAPQETDSGLVAEISDTSNALHSNVSRPKLNFFINGEKLERELTLYQEIYNAQATDEERRQCNLTGLPFPPTPQLLELWNPVHTITYKRADNPDEGRNSVLDTILRRKILTGLDKSEPAYEILLLLRVLESLNDLSHRFRTQTARNSFAEGKISSLDSLTVTSAPVVPKETFLSENLDAKFALIMQSGEFGEMPPWCVGLVKACRFLFRLDTRKDYFYEEYTNLPNLREGNMPDIRVAHQVVSRDSLFKDTVEAMQIYSGTDIFVEVTFAGEPAQGPGVTVEYYTLLGQEFQKVGLNMWRENPNNETPDEQQENKQGQFVNAPCGLFPRPYPPGTDASKGSQFSKVLFHFHLLGQVMAKALKDGRILDLPLSQPFYKLILGQELDLFDIKFLDPELYTYLQEMQAIVLRKRFLESMPSDNREEISKLNYRGASIEDLCLDFTLPGHPDYELKPDGSNISVDMDNLEEYISLIVDVTTKTGIRTQMKVFLAAFDKALPIEHLQMFDEHELDSIISGVSHHSWTVEQLADDIVLNQFTRDDTTIVNLFEAMVKFTPEEQRKFLQFVTGSPRLPIGGLTALNPRLAVVKKVRVGISPDSELPTSNTCFNLLKLPAYSTKELLLERLAVIMTHGLDRYEFS
eukprot:Gb_21912 [translate_table: standard]